MHCVKHRAQRNKGKGVYCSCATKEERGKGETKFRQEIFQRVNWECANWDDVANAIRETEENAWNDDGWTI